MAEISRMAGAMLVRTEGRYYQVGNLKEPCDYLTRGFMDPGENNFVEMPYIPIETAGSPELKGPVLHVDREGEDLCRILSDRLLIKRNGSVSNRLWNLILDAKMNSGKDSVRADWLVDMPDEVWEIVRDGVLRCA